MSIDAAYLNGLTDQDLVEFAQHDLEQFLVLSLHSAEAPAAQCVIQAVQDVTAAFIRQHNQDLAELEQQQDAVDRLEAENKQLGDDLGDLQHDSNTWLYERDIARIERSDCHSAAASVQVELDNAQRDLVNDRLLFLDPTLMSNVDVLQSSLPRSARWQFPRVLLVMIDSFSVGIGLDQLRRCFNVSIRRGPDQRDVPRCIRVSCYRCSNTLIFLT